MQTIERPELGEKMKFIIDGRTYDTATSTVAAYSRGAHHSDDRDGLGPYEERFDITLLRTKSGNFFAHDHTTRKYEKGKPIVTDEATALTPAEAVQWIIQFGGAVVDPTGLDLPDEA